MTAIEGQIEGGVLMGMGYALTENFITEDGYVRSKYGTLGLLRSTDRPEIEPILVHSEILPGTAFGSKGIGELCTIPTAPAIRMPIEGLMVYSGSPFLYLIRHIHGRSSNCALCLVSTLDISGWKKAIFSLWIA